MKSYDLAFIGHMCFDEVILHGGEKFMRPGSAVLCGAMAAARVGKRVLVVTKMNPADAGILDPMKEIGIDVHLVPARETTHMYVFHPSADVDVREIIQKRNAGFFTLEEIPAIDAAFVHLAGVSDQEFTPSFVDGLHKRGVNLSADMQSFVRRVEPGTGRVTFEDVPEKRRIVSLLNKVKLDVVEAKILTGTDDLEKAALQFEQWGAAETLVTQSAGVLARAGGKTHYEAFTNRNSDGRTGRGDTTFAGYLARRMDHGVAESLRFAAALVSIKMEKPGPFDGSLEDVLERMGAARGA